MVNFSLSRSKNKATSGGKGRKSEPIRSAGGADEHGRPSRAGPRHSEPAAPLPSSMSSSSARFGLAELQLRYGHSRVAPDLELDLASCEEVVRLCGEQIKLRGLEQPLLFSSRALDLNSENVAELIRSYLHNRHAWSKELQFANCDDLCALLKWALGRLINPSGGRGLLFIDMYERWRIGEREKGCPTHYISTHLLSHLPAATSKLLTTILSLMSSAAAYTVKNGTTPKKLAALFSSYIFALPDDQPFEATYAAFLRFTHATEHLLLAYIRDQQDTDLHSPTVLSNFIKDYPHGLQANQLQPSSTASLVPTARITRTVRFQSQDLIQTAGTWQVPRSMAWASIFSSSTLASLEGAPTLLYSPLYKQLLDISNDAGQADEEDDEAMQRYRNAAEKDWQSFRQGGFAKTDSDWLKFDLNASERTTRQQRHDTMDWNTFESAGFKGRETYVDTDLSFDKRVSEEVNNWPEERRSLDKQLRKTQKSLPPFPYDNTPQETAPVLIDEDFFEVWCDVLVSSGWLSDELKASNWALVQFRCQPGPDASPGSPGSDGRTLDQWFLIEEITPPKYINELQAKEQKGNRRISFLRTARKPTKKDRKASPPSKLSIMPPPVSSVLPPRNQPVSAPRSASGSQVDLSVFEPGPGATKHMKASHTPAASRRVSRKSIDAEEVYVPSEDAIAEHPVPELPTAFLQPGGQLEPSVSPRSPKFGGHGIGGTLSSQPPGFLSQPSSPLPPESPTASSSSHHHQAAPRKKRHSIDKFTRPFRKKSHGGLREDQLGVIDMSYEERSIMSSVEANHSHNEEPWTDVTVHPPQPTPSTLEAVEFPAPPPKDSLIPRVPVPSSHDYESRSVSPHSSHPRTSVSNEDAYDGTAEHTADYEPARESLEGKAVWRGSQDYPREKALPPPIDDAPYLPKQVEVQPSRIPQPAPSVPEKAAVETPVERAQRLRAKYGGYSSGASTATTNVSRLISMYAKRDERRDTTEALRPKSPNALW